MKALILMSGGIDSPVAAWKLQQAGLDVAAVHFSHEPLTDNQAELKARNACNHLGIKEMHVIKIGHQLAEIANKCNHRYYFIMQKRFMLRVAERLANELRVHYLATGENLGQVASQTLPNLFVIQQAIKIPLIRPLLCYDKKEIIAIARKIGTYEISVGPEICSLLGPNHPATRSSLETIEEEEKRLDYDLLLKSALNSRLPAASQ